MSDWRDELQGPKYVPMLRAAEEQYAIPPDLLARVAYQESHFREDIISGAVKSRAGCVGLMQLDPKFFPGAGLSPKADIETGAALLAQHYRTFKDWHLAVAAYNDGAGNIDRYLSGERSLPTETLNYVRAVFHDVPIEGMLV